MDNEHSKLPETIYSMIQATYWMGYCLVGSFMSVFLLYFGYSNSEIGLIASTGSILSVLFQLVSGRVLDKYPKIQLRKFTCCHILIFLMPAAFQLLGKKSGFLITVTMILVYSLANSLQPLLNSLCVQFEGTGLKINFGLARGLGSLTFAVMSFAMGKILLKKPPTILPKTYIAIFLCLIVWVLLFRYEPPRKQAKTLQRNEVSGIILLKKYKKFIVFLIGVICLMFGHSLINQYMIQIVTSLGADSDVMGKCFFMAAALELPAMFSFSKIKSKLSCGWWLCISSVFFTLKHLLIFLANSIVMLYTAQFMQIGGFALLAPAVVYYANECMEKEDQAKGQALVSASMTAAGIFASCIGGLLLDYTTVKGMLLVGAIVTAVGLILVFAFTDKACKIRS
ncbi:MFS transporter [Defluviitalea raffinosedens]|jgi:PPP family 3-phenylpropionic acid transporter|uniref:MFS transporter n=1 Tax=Defluviitalea raffinosedens TaxID=1450156 RepID=UPI0019572306|nr:MFS transporter [Defluviitalea raffinosedens]MBM7684429.1 PPP family 3-phenylpropionic acid transporter [Defluviitalea raffinosedens]